MSEKLDQFRDIKDRLIEENKPILCCGEHEVPIAQFRAGMPTMLPIINIPVSSATDIVENCQLFGHRTCAHRKNFGANVYDDEIEMLFSTNGIDEDEYHNLKSMNRAASVAIQRFDKDTRNKAKSNNGDESEFRKNQSDFKRRQIENWDTHVNPLRLRLIGLFSSAIEQLEKGGSSDEVIELVEV